MPMQHDYRDALRIRHDSIFAPFFIFIRCANQYDDRELLDRLGLQDYLPDSDPRISQKYLFIAEDPEWLHIGDDWHYTLWHTPEVHRGIDELAKQHDLFTCVVGDVDLSYAFAYYTHGHCVRHYVVDSPHYYDAIVTTNWGTPLPSEADIACEPDEWCWLLALARSLGINTVHQRAAIRVYTKAPDQ